MSIVAVEYCVHV